VTNRVAPVVAGDLAAPVGAGALGAPVVAEDFAVPVVAGDLDAPVVAGDCFADPTCRRLLRSIAEGDDTLVWSILMAVSGIILLGDRFELFRLFITVECSEIRVLFVPVFVKGSGFHHWSPKCSRSRSCGLSRESRAHQREKMAEQHPVTFYND
jgi:hypothetical protein